MLAYVNKGIHRRQRRRAQPGPFATTQTADVRMADVQTGNAREGLRQRNGVPAMNISEIRFALRKIAAMPIMLCSAAVLFAPVAHAVAPFSIDGNVPDADALEFGDPVGSIKELGPVNASDTKLGSIHTASPRMLEFTNPNSSTDLSRIWLKTEKELVSPGVEHVWLYFAWEREASTGSSVVSYEFQKNGRAPACDYAGIDQVEGEDAAETVLMDSCNPWSNRSDGDFIVVWDFGGGSTDVILRYFSEATSSFGGPINLSDLGFADAQLNADSTRGEGRINLTEAIFFNLDSCFSVANIVPGTITGNSDSSDYKDTVLADISAAVTISNCGSLTITKDTQPPGESGDFPYRLDRSSRAAINYEGNLEATGILQDDGGSDQLTLLPGTDYRLEETLGPDSSFVLDTIFCDQPPPGVTLDSTRPFSVNVSETTNCVINNELKLGTLTVRKLVDNRYDGTAVPSDFTLCLQDVDNTVFAGDRDGTPFSFLNGYGFTVAEGLDCGDSVTDPAGYEATYDGTCSGAIQAFTDLECVVTNTQQAQREIGLTLRKVVVTDNGGTAVSSDWTLGAALKSGSPAACTLSGFSGTDGGEGGCLLCKPVCWPP